MDAMSDPFYLVTCGVGTGRVACPAAATGTHCVPKRGLWVAGKHHPRRTPPLPLPLSIETTPPPTCPPSRPPSHLSSTLLPLSIFLSLHARAPAPAPASHDKTTQVPADSCAWIPATPVPAQAPWAETNAGLNPTEALGDPGLLSLGELDANGS